jgi:Ca2+-binding EF-hand superfamily protein
MKKLMLGAAALTMAITFSAPSFAREVTEVVGYVKTETYISDRDDEFRKIDTSGDGAINFKEFQRAAMLENEYEIFNMNDNNHDQLLSIQEWRDFSKTGPSRTNTGFNTSNFNKNPTP